MRFRLTEHAKGSDLVVEDMRVVRRLGYNSNKSIITMSNEHGVPVTVEQVL